MTTSVHDRVGSAFDLLEVGLRPFIERELMVQRGDKWVSEVRGILTDPRLKHARGDTAEDVIPLLVIMERAWGTVFRRILGKAERTLVNELIAFRERWENPEDFSADDAVRALDSAARLLAAVSAPEALEVDRMTGDLRRSRFEAEEDGQPTAGGTIIEAEATGALRGWREAVVPTRSVASGAFRQADFAADLWQVHLAEAADDYQKPAEFFRRTYLTESLRRLLVGAVQRLGEASGGDPVVQLQTYFGGGKTHAMLALYHLFSGAPTKALAGVDGVLKDAGLAETPNGVNRVVLVGNRISPGTPSQKADGTIVRTLWGELAWQLGFAAGDLKGAKRAFRRIAAHDENGTNPGDLLRQLLADHGPCLILIDEWVAYARQLHSEDGLAGGRFDTQFAFARSLIDAAKLAKRCLVVVSLPTFEFTASSAQRADDDQIGGQRGREALNRLYQAVGTVGASWRPANAREELEIVKRRLFEPISEPAQLVARDTVCGAFHDFYVKRHEFPPECRRPDYELRLKAAYPVHPEVFDRLYGEWSKLPKFQRTRGVLRFLAAVVHGLWENGDRNPLILPGTIPFDDQRVQFELTRFLVDDWAEVVAREVDGPGAAPAAIDAEQPTLAKAAAARRVARALFFGSSPLAAAGSRGIDEPHLKLGAAMPTEAPAVFGEALQRLLARLTHVHQDGHRYFYAIEARAPLGAIADTKVTTGATTAADGSPAPASSVETAGETAGGPLPGMAATAPVVAAGPANPVERRYRGTVNLDPRSVAVDAGRVADEVIAHLAGIAGVDLTVTLQIEAAMPKGADNAVLNTVGAASRALDFTSVGFE